MDEIKISQLPAASSANGTMEFETNDSGFSKKVTGAQLKTFAQSGLGSAAYTSSSDYATAAQGTKADTAFGWGNHASSGYAIYPSQTGNAGKVLKTDGSIVSWGDVSTVGSLNDLTDVTISSPASGQLLSYNGSQWINTAPGTATRVVSEFTATAGQTSFSPSGGYTVGYVDVFVNGAQLQTSDFTASNGTTVVLGTACTAGDDVRITAWGVFSVASVNGSNIVDGTVTDAKIFSVNYSKLTGTVPTWNQNTTGNAATATTATNQSGGTVSATTGAFSGQVSGKTGGSDTVASFYANTTGGAYATVYTRRGVPFTGFGSDSGSSYKPYVNMLYAHNAGWDGIYSLGVLNEAAANPGAFNIMHINSAGSQQYVWNFQGHTGNFTSPGNVTAYSDERKKKDWSDLPSDFVERLATVKHGTYTNIDSGIRQAGASAQAMREILPEVVVEGSDEEKTLSLAYGNAALVAAIELAKQVVELKKEIEELKKGN